MDTSIKYPPFNERASPVSDSEGQVPMWPLSQIDHGSFREEPTEIVLKTRSTSQFRDHNSSNATSENTPSSESSAYIGTWKQEPDSPSAPPSAASPSFQLQPVIYDTSSIRGTLKSAITTPKTEVQKQIQWKLDWKAPLSMIGLLLAGLGFAMIHHFYYASLEGTEALPSTGLRGWNTGSQEWKVRYGTALAFVSKTTIAAAISLAYEEHLWKTLQKKAITIKGLDAAFLAFNNIVSLFNFEYIRNVKLGFALALLSWTVNYVNRLVYRVAVATAIQQEILDMPAFVPNSSYSLTLYGPSLRCRTPKTQNVTDVINQMFDEAGHLIFQPTNEKVFTSKYIGFNPTIWMANASWTRSHSDFGVPYNLTNYVNYCLTNTSMSSDPELGDLCTSGDDFLWFRANNAQYICTIHNTSFDVTFTTLGDRQRIDQHYHWAWEESMASLEAQLFGAVMTPISDLVIGAVGLITQSCDSDPKCGGSHARIRRVIMTNTIASSAIPETLNVYSANSSNANAPFSNMSTAELIEDLSRNMTLSLFSLDSMLSSTPQNVTVRVSSQLNVFAYNSRNLLLPYGLSLLACTCSVVIGLRAYYLNGVSHNSSFSSIVSTTRNSTLDELMKGHSLGSEPLDKDISGTKLQFGVLVGTEREKGGLRRLGFGVPDEVMPLVRGASYY
ncbi:hypothetical protein G7Y89_g6667 [Cudoniella acicularis]|uniref:Uncharacterized protein n=1 Tax=Cudoniella acicularis TaxID=354080 RepID=A0A8H4W2T2_9HELO|nr:hypothetical protein G7Y89_g6667 [Cudoniella acicularis]